MSPLVLLGRRIPQMSSPKIAATLLSTRAELALKVARVEAVEKQRDYVAAQLAALQLELDILNSEHAALQAQCFGVDSYAAAFADDAYNSFADPFEVHPQVAE